MRAVIQRVENASVEIGGKVIAAIDEGLLVLIGFHSDDTQKDIDYIIRKILGLRVFNDEEGAMNLSVVEISGEVLLISQFTLYGNAHKGNRPSYSNAMEPVHAREFYDNFINRFKLEYNRTNSGIFGADMRVSLTNSGPVTIIIDSNKQF